MLEASIAIIVAARWMLAPLAVSATFVQGSHENNYNLRARFQTSFNKRRWAAFRAGRPATAIPKRRMSPAAKAKLAAVTKARWKKAKAAGRNAL